MDHSLKMHTEGAHDMRQRGAPMCTSTRERLHAEALGGEALQVEQVRRDVIGGVAEGYVDRFVARGCHGRVLMCGVTFTARLLYVRYIS